MGQFTELPDGWQEVEYETGPKRGDDPYTEELDATWASNDEEILIHAEQSVDADGRVTYPVVVEQHLRGDGYATEIQSHARVGRDRRDAESLAVEFMEDVNAGLHKLRVLGVQEPAQNSFIQFFTISDSEIPGEMTADQLIEVVNAADDYGNAIDALPDEITREQAEDAMVQVDVYPRHENEVEKIDET